jgi:hypothetical protein
MSASDKITHGPPLKTQKNNRSVGSAAAVQSGNLTGRGSDTTQNQKAEAAIMALRVGVEAAYAAADCSLLGGFEEVHRLLHLMFRLPRYRDWPFLPESLGPLEAAERRWFLRQILDVVGPAANAGLGRRVVQKIVFAPVLAAERGERVPNNNSKRDPRRLALLAKAIEASREIGDQS